MKLYFAVCMIAALAITGCKPDIKDIGEDYTAGDGIYGTWKMDNLKLTDLKQALPETRDITSFYAQDESRKLILRFDADKTYHVEQPGYLPLSFGSSGTWKYDAEPYPTSLWFFTNTGDTVITGLNNMVREIDVNFGFKNTRVNACGENYLIYNYTLTRQ